MDKAIQIAYNEFFEKKCIIAAKAGFRHISVNFNDTTDRSPENWAVAPENILRIMEENGLTCVQTHLPYYDLRISAELLDDEMEDAMKNSIEVSGKIGAPWCVYHPRSAVNDGFSSVKALEINKEVISKYLDWAIQAETGIALENLPVFPGIIPVMPFYASDYDDLCVLHDSFNTDRVSVCWDTGHANMMHFNQAKAIRHMGSRIRCTHIHNNFHRDDLHLTPDNGNIPWDQVMPAFRDIGYQGPLTLETHCLYQNDNLLQAFANFNFANLQFLEALMEG